MAKKETKVEVKRVGEDTKPALPQPGFNEESRRVVIQYEALKDKFGEDEAARKFREARNILGGGVALIETSGTEQFSDLSLVGISPTAREKVEAVLASKGE